MEFEGSLSEVG
jgi:hypothetical protein